MPQPKPKTDPLEEHHDDGGHTDPGDPDGGSGALADRIVEGLKDALNLGGNSSSPAPDPSGDHGSGGGGNDPGDPPRASDPDVSGARSTGRDTELDFEAKVRNALSRVRHEEQTESRLDKLEETTAAPPEAPPLKVSRIGRFLWGDPEKSRR